MLGAALGIVFGFALYLVLRKAVISILQNKGKLWSIVIQPFLLPALLVPAALLLPAQFLLTGIFTVVSLIAAAVLFKTTGMS